MQNYYYIRAFQDFVFRKTAETCNKAVLRILQSINGRTNGSILASHNWTFVFR